MRRVLLISSEFPPGPGGIGNHAFNLACAIAKGDNNVRVVTESDYVDKSDIRVFDEQNVTINTTRIQRHYFLTYFYRLFYYVFFSISSEIIVFTGKFPVWSIILLYPLIRKRKTIAVIHGSEVQLPSKWQRKLFDLGLMKCQEIVSVSTFTKSILSRKLQERTIIIPNGVNTKNNELISQATESKIMLLTVGNMTPRKGQHNVIKMMPKIVSRYCDVSYHIAGMPSKKQDLIELADDLDILKNIVFHDFVDNQKLESLYQQAKIFIMLSENQSDGDVEGFGIAILEANSFGVPSIGSVGCGIEDAIDDGRSGILVDSKSEDSVINAIDQILSNYESFQIEALDWAKKHSWENIGLRYSELF